MATALLISHDDALLDDLLRLAAAAGCALEVAHDSAGGLRGWAAASVVLVGADAAAGLAAVAPPRRPRVHLVGSAPLADAVFRDAVAVGAETVAALPTSETWLVELLTDVGDGGAAPGVTIGVVGGSGGAGATVFAAALVQRAALTCPALLVDADPLGAGSDRVLGLEAADGIRWDSLTHTAGRLSSKSLREALPGHGDLSVLTWPPTAALRLSAAAMREVLSAARRGFPVVVVDLPRHLDEVVEETVARCDHVVVVVAATVAGASSASRLVQRLPEGGPQRHLVVRGRVGGVSPDSVGRLLRLPLLTSMGDQRGLDEAVDLGVGPARRPRGALARAAQRAVETLVPTA